MLKDKAFRRVAEIRQCLWFNCCVRLEQNNSNSSSLEAYLSLVLICGAAEGKGQV